MSKKQEFIKYVEMAIDNYPCEMPEDAKLYWDAFKGKEEADKPMFTDNGKLILAYMQEHSDIPMCKARDIADGLIISSRAVSGAIRKLVTDGFVEKVGQDPVIYSLTDLGKNIQIED